MQPRAMEPCNDLPHSSSVGPSRSTSQLDGGFGDEAEMVSVGYRLCAVSPKRFSAMGDFCSGGVCLFVAKTSLGPVAAVQTNRCQAGRSTAIARTSQLAGRCLDPCDEFQTSKTSTCWWEAYIGQPMLFELCNGFLIGCFNMY